MPFPPMLMLHAASGTVGLFAGFAAMFLPKGSLWHRRAGNVFFVAMLFLGISASYLGFMKNQIGNFIGGFMTCYLVATAWGTARRRDGETHILDRFLVVVPLAVGTFQLVAGVMVATGRWPSDGVPVFMIFFLATIALLAAAGDIRMLMRGGVFGAQRVARHLWRMCFGLFIASGSFFMGPANRPLRFLRSMGLTQDLWRPVMSMNTRLVFTVLPLLLLIFWMVRVRVMKRVPGAQSAASVAAD